MKNTERVLRSLRRAQVKNVARMRERAEKAVAFEWIEQEEAQVWSTLLPVRRSSGRWARGFSVRAGNVYETGLTLMTAVKKARAALAATIEANRGIRC